MEIPSILIRKKAGSEMGGELTQYSYSAEREKSFEHPISGGDLPVHPRHGEFELIENQRNPGSDEVEATRNHQFLESKAAMPNSGRDDSLGSEWHESRLRRQSQPSGILTRESVDQQITGFFEKTKPSRKRPRM